jgi:hypothetical protein
METTTMAAEKSERRLYASSLVTPRPYHISWGAVFAGVVMGITVQVLLGALGVGIGASTIDPTREANPLAGIGIGAAVWLFVSTIAAYYASGWIAARMAGFPARVDGVLHGLLTWGFSTVFMLFLFGSMAASAVSGTAQLFGGFAQYAQSVGLPPAVTEAVDNAVPSAEQASAAAQDPQVQQQARAVGDNAARGTSAAGFSGFGLLLLAGIASAIGGLGGAKPLVS